MEKHALIYVMSNGKVVGITEDMNGVNELLNELSEGNAEFDFRGVHLLNVVDIVRLPTMYPLTYTPGDIVLGNERINDGTIIYKLNSGDWFGKEFEDEEELRDWVNEKVREGHMTLEDVKSLEISKEITDTVDFSDAEIADGEWKIAVENLTTEGEAAYNRMGVEFVTFEYMYSQLNQQRRLSQQSADVEDMSDEALSLESIALMERASKLMEERNRRARTAAMEVLTNDVK